MFNIFNLSHPQFAPLSVCQPEIIGFLDIWSFNTKTFLVVAQLWTGESLGVIYSTATNVSVDIGFLIAYILARNPDAEK